VTFFGLNHAFNIGLAAARPKDLNNILMMDIHNDTGAFLVALVSTNAFENTRPHASPSSRVVAKRCATSF